MLTPTNDKEAKFENQTLDVPSDAFVGERFAFVADDYEPLMIHEAFAERHGATIENEITPKTGLVITNESVDEALLKEAKEFGVGVWHYGRFERYLVQNYSSHSRMKEVPDEDTTTNEEEVEAPALDAPSDELDGLTFVFSGMDNEPLLILESFARIHGATVENEITSETDYLVRGEYVDKDLRKRAEIQKVPMIHFIEFEAYVVHGVFPDEQEVESP